MSRLIASILLVATIFSIFADVATIEVRAHNDNAAGIHSLSATDATVSDVSQCPDCPISNDRHTCHLGHTCHCASLASAVPFSFGIEESSYLPSYEFALPSDLVFGIIRPPIFA